MAGRIKYSKDQVKQYYDRIAISDNDQHYSVKSLTEDQQLELLTTIVKHHVIRIPFENLVQHYSWHRVINTHAQHLFRKIIEQPGRGGYCMEVNSLLHTLLLSLEFKCYTAPARVRTPGSWTAFTHLVNIVRIGNSKYLCDVGFGNDEPLRPVKMDHGHMTDQIRPTQTRLVYEEIPEHLSDYKMWVMQSRINAVAEWQPLYCFSEMEVMPTDIESLNYGPWKGRHSPFTKNIWCVRYTVGDDPEYDGVSTGSVDSGEIDGILIINNNHFKWRRSGKVIIEKTFADEGERVEALRKYWGIELDSIDVQAIAGSVTAIALQ